MLLQNVWTNNANILQSIRRVSMVSTTVNELLVLIYTVFIEPVNVIILQINYIKQIILEITLIFRNFHSLMLI